MAQGKVGTKIYIDGVPEYTAAIKNIKSAQTELRSEMRLLSAEYKNTANSEEALKAKHEVLTKQMQQSEKQIAALERVIKGYEDKLKDQKVALDEAKQKHGEESEEVRKAQEEYDKLNRNLELYKTRLNSAKTDMANYNAELTKTDQYLDEAAHASDHCATSIDQFGKETKEAGEEIKDTSEALEAFARNEVFKTFEETAEKIVEALGECVEAADQFEYAMTKVQSIAQVDDSTLSGMGEQIQELAVTYGASANEIAEATYQAISASVDAGEATDFVANAMKLARGGFTDTVTAVDVLTTTLNAYGKEANTTEHIMDALVTTQNLGKTTVGELAQNLGQVIPTAAGLNVSLDNLSAAYIQLTKNGVNTANSTTYINGMLTELSDKGSAVGKVLKKETGQSFGELMASGKSLGDVIQILGENVNGNSEAFLNMFGNVRAARGALTIFNNGADAFNASLEAIGDSAGAANEAFETMADTSEMTNKRMEAAVENLKVSIGEALLPTFDQMKEAGISVLEPLTAFVEDNPQIVMALAGVAAGVMGVTTAMTACTAATTILRAAFGDLSGAAAVLGTAAVVGGIAGLTIATEEAASSADTLAKSAREAGKANADMAKDTEASVNYLSSLAEKIKEYGSRTSLSQQEQAELNGYLQEFNELMPEANLAYDENTGKIIDNTNALEANVDALIEQAKAAIYKDELDELTKSLAKHQIELDKVTEEYGKMQKRLEDTDWYGAADQEAMFRDETEKTGKSIEKMNAVVEDEKARVEELQGKIKGATEASEEFAEEQDDVAASTGPSEDALEELAKKYEKARESAVSSLQSQKEKFQELGEAARKGAEQSGESIDQFAQRIADQRKGIEEYSGNVEKALEFMLDNKWSEGLFSTIIQEGPEASGDLKMLLDTIEEGEDGVKKLKETCEDFDAFAPISEQVGEFQAKLETGIPITEEAIKKNQELIDSQGNVVHAYEDGHAAYKTHVETMEETAAQLPEDVANAVTSTASKVAETEEKMLTDAIDVGYGVLGMEGEGAESTVFKDMGNQIVTSFVSGLSDPEGSVGEAIKSLCDAAVGAVDISGLSDKLSERVAKIVGEAEKKMGEQVVAGATRQANMGGGNKQ